MTRAGLKKLTWTGNYLIRPNDHQQFNSQSLSIIIFTQLSLLIPPLRVLQKTRFISNIVNTQLILHPTTNISKIALFRLIQ
jgi:hypothetical protein